MNNIFLIIAVEDLNVFDKSIPEYFKNLIDIILSVRDLEEGL